jgi:hypothetical protein
VQADPNQLFNVSQSSDNWSLREWRSNSTAERRIFRKNLSSDVGGYRATHSHIAYFSFSFTPKDEVGLPAIGDFDALSVIEEAELDFLLSGGIAVFAAVVTVPGTRDFIFYINSPESFLARVEAVLSRHPKLRGACQISPDPDWSQYDELP